MPKLHFVNPLETKRTLTIIIILLVLTMVLFGMSLSGTSQHNPTPTPSTHVSVTPLSTTLALTPAHIQVPSSHTTTLQVVMDTGVNNVTGIQLGLKYDPAVVSSISVSPVGTLDSKKVLFTTNDKKKGLLVFAAVVPNTISVITGKGTIADVHISFKPAASGSTSLYFFPPETLVTAKGANIGSVLKNTAGATLLLSTQ